MTLNLTTMPGQPRGPAPLNSRELRPSRATRHNYRPGIRRLCRARHSGESVCPARISSRSGGDAGRRRVVVTRQSALVA